MSSTYEDARLERLLDQLYLKKRWLDSMITGLESAMGSTDWRFIELLTRLLSDSRRTGPIVDLDHKQQKKLGRLASRVRRTAAVR